MADNTLGALFASALEAQANRPVKTSQKTTTTEKPLEYDDMLARRNQIGAERAALAKALEKRDNFGYRFANALSQMPAQQGAGSWLSDFARAFGAAYNAKTDMRIDKAERDYEKAQRDLADALMYDKAMGTEATQDSKIRYDEEPESTTGSSVGGGIAVNPQKLTAGADWLGMLKFDEKRKTAEAYREETENQRKFENATAFMGDADEKAARDEFNRAIMLKFVDARQRLKGGGQISDHEDKKYSEDIAKLKDPVALYDYTFNWANNLAAVRAGKVPVEDILFTMGITPDVIEAYGIPKVARREE
jgi:hypothetical protein